MERNRKTKASGLPVAQENVIWINFNDKAIDKLFIKNRNRITVKFKNIKVPYLNGLVLRYLPLI